LCTVTKHRDIMGSLQNLLGNADKFYDLLEASAKQAFDSAQACNRLLKSGATDVRLDEFAHSRRADKRITAEIHQEIAATMVTTLDREDLLALSAALYKIPKTVEKFAERFSICTSLIEAPRFVRQGEMMESAAQIVLRMVASLRHLERVQTVQEDHASLQRIEGEADKLMIELLRELYTSKYEAAVLVALKDLYELLEKVIDSCRDAGKVVFQIALKNS